jgi:hypothetical protein
VFATLALMDMLTTYQFLVALPPLFPRSHFIEHLVRAGRALPRRACSGATKAVRARGGLSEPAPTASGIAVSSGEKAPTRVKRKAATSGHTLLAPPSMPASCAASSSTPTASWSGPASAPPLAVVLDS